MDQFVQEAVFQCVQRLNNQQPDMRVGLITFNDQVNTPLSGICLVSQKKYLKKNTKTEFVLLIMFCFQQTHTGNNTWMWRFPLPLSERC